MGKRKTKGRPAGELDNLDSTVVAVPLQEALASDKTGRKKHRVIVEINLLHPVGRDVTKDDVVAMITGIGGEKSLNKALATDTDQYVFANLTTGQIRRLARENEAQRERSGGWESQRLRPIYKIWPDFNVELLLNRSVSTVKADAALAAFAAAGRHIIWAVIDSGIDGSHRHFQTHGNLKLDAPLTHCDFSGGEPREISNIKELTDDSGHGTHVAGIIAGEAKDVTAFHRQRDEENSLRHEELTLEQIQGVAPQCKLLSLKVADANGHVRASSIIAALGYVRRLNGDGRLPRIHGVNISLGHQFNAEWFGCGQSPLCVEVDRLVRSGTVVVVAAGNGGYGRIDSKYKGCFEAGISGTIRDPGNANLAITVGSTHRDMPHVYGVSYFSAKGPTGDGRHKPDLVAPGERIISCAAKDTPEAKQGFDYKEDSGTSMAAPHVSGCIAAFLSIRREFKNQPERIKEIFMNTATTLDRERYYQGAGLVDLMRAIQSV